MSVAVSLVALTCPACQTPIPAQPDEVVWVCQNCGGGSMLNDDQTLETRAVLFSNQLKPGQTGLPYWVVDVQARLTRETFRGNRTDEMQAFWQQPRQMLIAAFRTPLEDLVQRGVHFLRQPPVLQQGPAAGFKAVIVSPRDVQAYVEFIVFQLEAERKDDLKQLQFQLTLSDPQLWVLPG